MIAFAVSQFAAPVFSADYLGDIKPLLEHKCYACHGAFKQQGGLRLDTAKALKRGGDSGSPIESGKPGESYLIDVLTGEAGFRMPPENEGTPLTDEELQLVRDWISSGAAAPADEEPQANPKTWWSYQPIERPPVPKTAESSWPRGAIDSFIAAKREEQRLPHVVEASKNVWLRRVYLDLIGLPPTRAEQHAFLTDESPNAYEKVVDDLLARPQYGERWGRHWMDVWRYSDWYGSRGINEIRYSQRHIWRWRDWIVASLNDDKGYDQMIREMLAADEIAGGDVSVLPATGYLGRSWYKFDRNVWMFETVERTGEAFLGLTLRCCRCHDHKFDPITQEEYYRFRAFFEPHNVRTDPISALTTTQKDATLGQVLNDGIALVYDKDLDVPTYRFERGDSRYPDESKPLVAGVPDALGGEAVQIATIDLPPEAWYPMLRADVRETLVEKAELAVASAERKVEEANAKVRQTLAKVESAKSSTPPKSLRPSGEKVRMRGDSASGANTNTPSPQPSPASGRGGTAATAREPKVFLHDDFAKARPDTWKTIGGTWVYEDGKLVETAVTSFATIVTKENHPSDFKVHLRYRPLEPGGYRSIGFSFDYQDQGNSHDVYTSTNDTRQSVQAFHRTRGKQVYPKAGIVYTELKVGEEATLDVDVQGSQLIIELNGERKLEYSMPLERRDGKFALWVHQGAAEFLELKITEHAESLETLQRRHRIARREAEIADHQLKIAKAESQSVDQRIAATVSEHLEDDPMRAEKLAFEASAAELQVAVLQAELEIIKLQGNTSTEALAKANDKLAAARKAAETPTTTYTSLGEQYPKTSTGRRAALAEWIASSSNPRTARVAVNHLWGRHFGQPLVATPENFGLNGHKPTHPQLLDWLAAELIANDWNMKPLHRQIVLSSTYRMESNASNAEQALAADPENKFLWRMNSRRMEAEVVRDSTLHLAKHLDMKFGGPEIPETDGEKVLRRSMYFRNTPNEKMLMLEVFDVADPNSCYRRKESVVPHQSLAMMNSGLTIDHARIVASQLAGESNAFVKAAFETILARSPTKQEAARCEQFINDQLKEVGENEDSAFAAGGSAKSQPSSDPLTRAQENLIHVLLLHNDFVTIR